MTDLNAMRGKIDALKNELAAILDGPLTAAEARARLKIAVDGADVEGSPLVQMIEAFAYPGQVALPYREPLTLADLAGILGRDQLAGRLFDLVKARCEGGVSVADRSKRRVEALKELRALEVEEERFILAESAKGRMIDRRGDANPAILLELWSK